MLFPHFGVTEVPYTYVHIAKVCGIKLCNWCPLSWFGTLVKSSNSIFYWLKLFIWVLLNLWQLLLVHDSQTGSIKLSIMETTMSRWQHLQTSVVRHITCCWLWTGMLMFHRGWFLWVAVNCCVRLWGGGVWNSHFFVVPSRNSRYSAIHFLCSGCKLCIWPVSHSRSFFFDWVFVNFAKQMSMILMPGAWIVGCIQMGLGTEEFLQGFCIHEKTCWDFFFMGRISCVQEKKWCRV
jgi:hypothetical protein